MPRGSRVYAYLADACGALHIVDVTAPTSPTRISSLNLPASAYDVFIVGTYAYLASDVGILVVDVSNLATPRLVHTYRIPYVQNVYANGSRLYAATVSGLYVLDISNPSAPQEIAYAYSWFSGWGPVFATDRYIFWGDTRTGLGVLSLTTGMPGAVNRPPVARIQMCAGNTCRREGERLEVVVASGQTASVRLSGHESTDPDGDLLTYHWAVDGTSTGTGREIEVSLGPGEHTVQLIVEDGRGGRQTATGWVAVLVSGVDEARIKKSSGLVEGSTATPGEALVKIWELVNRGNTTWDPSTHFLERVDGTIGPQRIQLPRAVPPGGSASFVWQAQAPTAVGTYGVAYQMRGPQGRFGPVLRISFRVAQGNLSYGPNVLDQASKLEGMQYRITRALTIDFKIINTPTDYFSKTIRPEDKYYYKNLGKHYYKYGVCTDVPIDGTYFALNIDIAKQTGEGARNTDCLLTLLTNRTCGNKTLTNVLGSGWRYIAWVDLNPNELEMYVDVRPGDLIFFKWKQGAWNETWPLTRRSHHVGIVQTVTADGRPNKILHNGGRGGLTTISWSPTVKNNTELVHIVRLMQVSGSAGLSAADMEIAQAESAEIQELPHRLVIALEGAGIQMDIRDEWGRFVPRFPDPNILAVHEHNWIPYVPARTDWVEIGNLQVVTLTTPPMTLGTHYTIRLSAGTASSYRLQVRLLRGEEEMAVAEQMNSIGTGVWVVHLDIGPMEEGFRLQITPPMSAARLIVPEEVVGSATSGLLQLQIPIRSDPSWEGARKVRLTITDLRYGFFDALPMEHIQLSPGPVDLGPGESWVGWVAVDLTGIPPGRYVGRAIISADNAAPETVSLVVEVREAQAEHRLFLPLILRGP